VQTELVDQPCRQVLVHRVRAAGDRDVLLARCRARLRQRHRDPVGDEGERGATFYRQIGRGWWVRTKTGPW
jgi:hypothetical protein